MKKKHFIIGLLIGILAMGIIVACTQTVQPSKDVKWEYTSLNIHFRSADFVTKANELGKDGWELVLISSVGDTAVFKRPLR